MDLVPVKLVESEKDEEGNTVLLYPRFKNAFFRMWLTPKNRSPFIKIKLDSIGSAFWEECDNKKDVFEIGNNLKNKFGDSIEPVFDRLKVFIINLRKGDYLELKEKTLNSKE